MATKEHKATDYWWYKERGFCVRCRREKARPGKTMCEACAEKARQREARRAAGWTEEQWEQNRRSDREERAYFVGHGICPQCHQQNAAPGRRLCEACSAKRRDTYARYKAAGLCVRCGKTPPRKGMTRCEACAQRQKKTREARKHER